MRGACNEGLANNSGPDAIRQTLPMLMHACSLLTAPVTVRIGFF